MSDAKKPEEKKEKVNFHQQLKDKRGLLTSLRKDIQNQTAIRKNEHAEALKASLSERQKGIKVLREKADSEKEKFKHVYDVAKKIALEEYEAALTAITNKRDDEIKAAHELKEHEYHRINDELNKDSVPLLEKHRDDVQAINEKYEKAESQHVKAGEEAVRALQAEIEALEAEIAKRAERHQKPRQPEEAPAA